MDIFIGLLIGLVLALMGLYLLDRHYKQEMRKLQESRNKLERQRTQAVNDLFAIQNATESGTPGSAPGVVTSSQMSAELANLKNLVVRADAALTVARRKRSEYEAEIAELQDKVTKLETDGTVINLSSAKSNSRIS